MKFFTSSSFPFASDRVLQEKKKKKKKKRKTREIKHLFRLYYCAVLF
jgi:hypothetical protein